MIEVLGIGYNLAIFTTDKRKKKLRRICMQFLDKFSATRVELLSLHGKLMFPCTNSMPLAKPLLRSVLNLALKVKKDNYTVQWKGRVDGEKMRKDLRNFISLLDRYPPRPFVDVLKSEGDCEVEVWTDASELAAGGFCGTRFFQFDWVECPVPGYVKSVRTKQFIDWQELCALAAAFQIFEQQLRGKTVLFWVDNTVVENVVRAGSSPVRLLMPLVKLIYKIALRSKIRFFLKHVTSEDNAIADALSRNKWEEFEILKPGKKKRVFPDCETVCYDRFGGNPTLGVSRNLKPTL